MLIEQIIEFEFGGPELPGRTCTFTAGYFHDKTKISKKNVRVDFYLVLKCCRRRCTLLSPTLANSLPTFNPTSKILNVFWTLIVSKKKIEQFNIFNWLSKIKNLVVSSDSKHVRNVIQWH